MIDYFLNGIVHRQKRQYVLATPIIPLEYQIRLPGAAQFIQSHGYFSNQHPLVGKVSTKDHELARQATYALLNTLSNAIFDRKARAFALAETLTKIIAYRDFTSQDHLCWRSPSTGKKVTYRIDRLFDLWHGMPAFGLINEEGEAPILLFRGTDFSLASERGWASLLSDLDPHGPGLSSFMHARPQIHQWLKNMAQTFQKAKVMGFSLGGAFATYTFLYENAFINLEGCLAFNPPGCSLAVFQDWQQLPSDIQNCFTTYVNRSDPISKIGRLVGNAYQLSIAEWPSPLKAHTLFLTAEKKFIQTRINTARENQSRV